MYFHLQIEIQQLKFYTPDRNGKSKCHKIHVGKENVLCPELKVFGTILEQVKDDIYLGDIVSHDGSNQKNIKSRIGKGLGIISQIMNILETVSFGNYFFEIALTLRESMFINGILTNAEIWYNVKQSEIEEIEELDRLLLRKIFGTKSSCPREALFLESGAIPLGIIIKSRRLNYLNYLLKESPESMLSQFFLAQWNNEVKNDWTAQVRMDLDDFGIPVDLEYVKSISKESFKRLVKVKSLEFALSELNLVKEKHSKMQNLFYPRLEMQRYLKLKNMTPEDARLMFAHRVRMADYSENFWGGLGPSCAHYATHTWITRSWRLTAQNCLSC